MPHRDVEISLMNKREEIIRWLNDAYAMERALEIMLEKQTENADVHRAIRERAGIHLDETRAHIQHVAQCLQILGAEPSVLKTTALQVLEIAKNIRTVFAADERVKDYLAAVGSEYFEVACYKALVAAARDAHEEEIIPMLEENLKQDQAMARWLDDNIEPVIRDYLGSAPGGNRSVRY
jgi:ferritin-like metal-binding protein YciE